MFIYSYFYVSSVLSTVFLFILCVCVLYYCHRVMNPIAFNHIIYLNDVCNHKTGYVRLGYVSLS